MREFTGWRRAIFTLIESDGAVLSSESAWTILNKRA